MTRQPDGGEVLCTLALPLPVDVAAALGQGITNEMEKLGWSDVVLLTDGTNSIAAKPPRQGGDPE